MHTIDKEQFGRFVAALRKERGLTQKDLAQQLYLSDKAVSKWETGGSVPDIAVLTPLAEALGVTVAELLACRRLEGQQPMDSNEVDHLVQKALHLREGESDNLPRKKRVAQYLLCLGLCAAELGAVFALRRILNDPLLVPVLLGAVFGAYFFLFAGGRLPAYYDENRISSFSHGPVRLNLSGLVYFNNRIWPHILPHLVRVHDGSLAASLSGCSNTAAGYLADTRAAAVSCHHTGWSFRAHCSSWTET